MMRGVWTYLVAMMIAGSAQAGAWEEFERRCLVPMENVQEPIISDLTPVKRANAQGDAKVLLYAGPDFALVQTLDEMGSTTGCYVQGAFSASSEENSLFSNSFHSWKRSKIRDGEYSNPEFGFEFEGVQYEVAIYSSQTREPVLRVALVSVGNDQPLMAVAEETDLES